jgi:hypothetical protein
VPPAQVPQIQATIYPTGIVLTAGGHVSDLASRVANPHFVNPTSFVVTLNGVDLTSGSGPPATTTVTSPTGMVSQVSITPGPNGVQVSVTLRTPASNDNVAVGAGTEVQITFS